MSSRRSSNTIERPTTRTSSRTIPPLQVPDLRLLRDVHRRVRHSIAESQHSHGESEAGEDLKLPPLHEALELLYKLVKPMNRSFKPTSLQEMIEHCTVPKDYKGFADIDESAAKAIWNEIALKHPKAKILEDVPLDAVKVAKFSWHEKLLAKMHEYNEH